MPQSQVTKERDRSLLTILGPGILYAAAAVGISHLVQSTRAGAIYGLAMAFVIVMACAVKYPALRFGGEFSAASGRSLIDNYRDKGWWAILIYAFAQMFSMFFAVAAVTLVNVGLIKTTLGLDVSDIAVAAVLLAAAVLLLLTGRYHFLERMTKFIVAIFTILIVVTVILVVGQVEWTASALVPPHFDYSVILFVLALMGFMPSPMDACVLQSLWTCAKGKDTGRMPTPRESRLDFNVGYLTSVVLALCFMLLGAGVMFHSGITPMKSAAGFSAQVIELFTTSIGAWAYPIIGLAAVAVMLSTLLTLLDGYPRIVEGLFNSMLPTRQGRAFGLPVYDMAVIGLATGVVAIIGVFMTSFTAFIDMTAVIVFLTGPILAYLNHSAMLSADVPIEYRPGKFMQAWSLIGIVIMVILAIVFLYYRLNSPS